MQVTKTLDTNNYNDSFHIFLPRSNSNTKATPASSSRLLKNGNVMTKSSSVKELLSFSAAKHNKYSQCRRTKSCINMSFETPTDNVPNISDSLISSDETIKGKFYRTMKKVSTTQTLNEDYYAPRHSPKLIIVKPVMPIK